MTGRAEPSQEELRANLHKRMYLLEHGPGSRNSKRYNRHGVTNADVITSGEGSTAGAAGGGLNAAVAVALDSGSGVCNGVAS
jgi:hypothetical protein